MCRLLKVAVVVVVVVAGGEMPLVDTRLTTKADDKLFFCLYLLIIFILFIYFFIYICRS